MANSQTAVFNFESDNQIRSIILAGEPWFVAQDICNALRIQNVTQALEKLDNDERSMLSIGVNHRSIFDSRVKEINIISYSGLFTIILRCRDAMKPGTIPYRFRKWVTSEVLPQILKTGRYVSDELTSEDRARMLAQEMTSNMLPAIMDALQVEQKKYTYPIKPGYMDHIHSAEGARMLTQKSNLWDLLRELQANGNDIDAAAAEMVVMCNYITGALQCFDQIRTHVAFISSKASGY